MSQLFFTSDHHFGHANIIKYCDRPFENVEAMNRVMIERWNEKVAPEDEVYHLGDFGMSYATRQIGDILDQLNGTKYLIMGNHEGAALNHRNKFKWLRHYYELKVEDPETKLGFQRIILFHYALRTWRGAYRGNWHLYGHSHGNLPDLEDQLCFDIGVDSHDFYPLSYKEVKAIMQAKNWEPPANRREKTED